MERVLSFPPCPSRSSPNLYILYHRDLGEFLECLLEMMSRWRCCQDVNFWVDRLEMFPIALGKTIVMEVPRMSLSVLFLLPLKLVRLEAGGCHQTNDHHVAWGLVPEFLV